MCKNLKEVVNSPLTAGCGVKIYNFHHYVMSVPMLLIARGLLYVWLYHGICQWCYFSGFCLNSYFFSSHLAEDGGRITSKNRRLILVQFKFTCYCAICTALLDKIIRLLLLFCTTLFHTDNTHLSSYVSCVYVDCSWIAELHLQKKTSCLLIRPDCCPKTATQSAELTLRKIIKSLNL